jgi:hypothetical protein
MHTVKQYFVNESVDVNFNLITCVTVDIPLRSEN